MKTELYFVGIDGGGTKCRARLENENGTLLGEGISGPANIMRDRNLAVTSMVDAVEKAISHSGLKIGMNQCVVGAGLAGANINYAKDNLARWEHPFLSLHVLSDLHAACIGAHDGQDGAVIIIGTGSSGTRWHNNAFYDIGGHGFPVGDIASGAWLGLRAIQHTLLCLDGLEPSDALSHAICSQLNADKAEDIVTYCANFNTHHYASLVEVMLPLLNNNEPTVSKIFIEGASYIEQVAHKLLATNSLVLSMIGGLSDIYAAKFSSSIKARLAPCKATPQHGALYFAKSTYSQSKGVQ